MKRLISIILALLCVQLILAQSDNEQVLVYRNTGETNLFFAHELDSIVLSNLDADSLWHETPVAQVFYTQDTALVVSLTEIDSVAFGCRNETTLQPDARIITEDSIWIVRYEENCIFYKSNTPKDILPKLGDRLFYGKQDALFPCGLIARVDEVAKLDGEHRVCVTDVELKEVFSRLFFAGSISETLPTRGTTKAVVMQPYHRELKMDLNPIDNLSLGGDCGVTISGKVVAEPLKGYFHMEGIMEHEYDVRLAASAANCSGNWEGVEYYVPLGTYALVFTPHLNLSAFLDIDAEVSANLKTTRKSKQCFTYTKALGKDPVFTVEEPTGWDYGTLSQVDLLCKGELYFGWQSTYDMNILREAAGARLKLKAGPSLQGEVGIGVIAEASSEYEAETYGVAKLNVCLKLSTEGTVYYRKGLWGNVEDEHTICSAEITFLEREVDLFPKFFQSRAVQGIAGGNTEVSVATKSNNEILTNVETGFQIVDVGDNVLDSVFTDSIYAGRIETQGISDEFELNVQDAGKRGLKVRPVFRYAGYTIPAQYVSVMSDPNLQPVVFGFSNGAANVLSGLPFTGYAKNEEVICMSGPYMPVPRPDSVFQTKPNITMGTFIDTERHRLVGIWTGEEDGQETVYTFDGDGTGSYDVSGQETRLSYEVNAPQSGRITLRMGEHRVSKILYVSFIDGSVLKFRTRPDSEVCVFRKQSTY